MSVAGSFCLLPCTSATPLIGTAIPSIWRLCKSEVMCHVGKHTNSLAPALHQAVLIFAISPNPNVLMACSRSTNFCTLPLAVMGYDSTNWM